MSAGRGGDEAKNPNRSRSSQSALDVDARSARELIGSGPSQIERAQAMRVRDVNRPTDDELDEAETSVQIVHRNWKPQK